LGKDIVGRSLGVFIAAAGHQSNGERADGKHAKNVTLHVFVQINFINLVSSGLVVMALAGEAIKHYIFSGAKLMFSFDINNNLL
jgi:type VI protein secretion system component Hcp